MDLVADYGSDSDEDSTSSSPIPKQEPSSIVSATATSSSSKSLLECSGASSSSESDDQDDDSPAGGDTTVTVHVNAAGSHEPTKAETHSPLPLPNIAGFVPSGEAAIFKPPSRGLYDSVDALPGVKRRRSHDTDGQSIDNQYNTGCEHSTEGLHEGEDDDSRRKRRKRYGVTDTLQPPRRAVQPLRNQIHRDQPWLKRNKR
eukprot:scpid77896/ scgid10514/ 